MRSRSCLGLVVAAVVASSLLASGCAPRHSPAAVPPARPVTEVAADVDRLADRYVDAFLLQQPEQITYFGIPGRKHDRLSDSSAASLRRWEALEDELLASVRSIDEATLVGRKQWATLAMLREMLEGSVALRVCHPELWSVNQFQGWQVGLGTLADLQPMGTEEQRAQALARFGEVARVADTEIVNLREGLRRGYSAPRGNVRLVIGQMDSLLNDEPRRSPFFLPAQHDGSPEARAAFGALIERTIKPALRRYRDFLEKEYLPAARETIGVSALPDGAACYRASIRSFSTLDVTPEAVHQQGLAQNAAIDELARTISKRSFGGEEPSRVFASLASDPKYAFHSRDEIIESSRAAVARARAAMPRWFGILPKADVIVSPVPEFRERSAVGEYVPGAEDGTRPGQFLIATYDPEKRSRSGPESVTFHETIPGHHLQMTIAVERGGSHPISRYAGNSGYAEGWALYAEGLADEMGLFSADIDRMGMLSERALRASRLVLDSGIHAFGWSRERSIAYLRAHTVLPMGDIETEIDRYVIWPGQATAYMLGMLEIRSLRAEAERDLGPAFDIRQFHDRVLEDGAIPLGALRAKVERWIRERRTEPR